MNEACQRYCRYLETLTPDTLDRLGDYVTDDVRFKGPFNDVSGIDNMTRVFRHMFDNVDGIRFTVEQALSDDDRCLLAWRFEGRLSGEPWRFEGTSVLRLAADGRVSEHIDHWDSGQAFYERLPVIGWLLRRIRNRLAIR